MIKEDTHFLIIGLGLIGGSYAKALRKQGYKVSAISRSLSTIDYAVSNGIIDEGTTEVDPSLIQSADVIIFGLYPAKEVEWVKEYQHLFRPGTLLTDVTGVKEGVVDTIQSFLRKDVEFISVHPMAGKEVYGVQNADEKIFEKANYIVVPTEKNTSEAIELVSEMGKQMGFKRVSQLSISEHDEIIGFVSQLTHVIAISLMTCNEDENLQNYTGDSFRDLTRIARINETMWSELFIANKKALLAQIDGFEAQLLKIRAMIENEDAEGLKEVMRKSTERRSLFDK